jgi:hypothetical protein
LSNFFGAALSDGKKSAAASVKPLRKGHGDYDLTPADDVGSPLLPGEATGSSVISVDRAHAVN